VHADEHAGWKETAAEVLGVALLVLAGPFGIEMALMKWHSLDNIIDKTNEFGAGLARNVPLATGFANLNISPRPMLACLSVREAISCVLQG
jgi:hypothetical protein